MSHTSIHVIPDEEDLTGVHGGLQSDELPWLKVTQNFTIQFQPEDHEFAVRYLTKLADEARKLAQQITEAHPEQQS